MISEHISNETTKTESNDDLFEVIIDESQQEPDMFRATVKHKTWFTQEDYDLLMLEDSDIA